MILRSFKYVKGGREKKSRFTSFQKKLIYVFQKKVHRITKPTLLKTRVILAKFIDYNKHKAVKSCCRPLCNKPNISAMMHLKCYGSKSKRSNIKQLNF